MIKIGAIVARCIAAGIIAIGMASAPVACTAAVQDTVRQATPHGTALERRTDQSDGWMVLALALAASVPTFVVSQLLLLLVGPKATDIVMAHCASLLITGFAAGMIFTEASGFAGTAALGLVAAPQLFWLLIDLIRARPQPPI